MLSPDCIKPADPEGLPVTDVTQEGTAVPPETGAAPEERPLAVVAGRPLTRLPDDLYIPPDALEVFLETFEGPLDLLLYLIKRNNMDILDIHIAGITRQYMAYVELMQVSRLELAAEYLVMAATLAEIKSRMLLPRQSQDEDEGEEVDPRAELIRRLQQYERFRKAAEDLDDLPRLHREIYPIVLEPPVLTHEPVYPDIDLQEVLVALAEVMRRPDLYEQHQVMAEALSTRERMSQVLAQLRTDACIPFIALYTREEGRLGVVVTFLAVLELIKDSLVELVQTEFCGPIHLKARAGQVTG
ncbi:MAG: ScpA family protein [Kistimonas sp.]|nr:ScpA family protein [Kistimonas sp.]